MKNVVVLSWISHKKLNRVKIEGSALHKKDARDAAQKMSNGMEKLDCTNRLLVVCNARGLLFGEYLLIALAGVRG